LNEVGCEGVDWIKLAQGKIQLWVFVDTPQRHPHIKLQITTTGVNVWLSTTPSSLMLHNVSASFGRRQV